MDTGENGVEIYMLVNRLGREINLSPYVINIVLAHEQYIELMLARNRSHIEICRHINLCDDIS